MVIPTEIDALKTNLKRVVKGQDDLEIREVEAIQTTA